MKVCSMFGLVVQLVQCDQGVYEPVLFTNAAQGTLEHQVGQPTEVALSDVAESSSALEVEVFVTTAAAELLLL